MSASDLVAAVLVLAASAWLLRRGLRGGPCAGCSGGGCGKRAAPDDAVVGIGDPRRGCEPPTR